MAPVSKRRRHIWNDPSEARSLFPTLCIAERSARARLITGCEQDLKNASRFLERPLANARLEATYVFHALTAAAHEAADRRAMFARIASQCADVASDNIGLRARARFRMYSDALAAVESDIAIALRGASHRSSKRILPRMFAMQKVVLKLTAAPTPPLYASGIPVWVARLESVITQAIVNTVEAALARTTQLGLERLGIVKSRIDLALYDSPTRSLPSSDGRIEQQHHNHEPEDIGQVRGDHA